ncbi:Gp15 family bacteriophage protein [[Clostridium] innocuum]|nr:Gp15 family bacteriophage protein [[Clostridium] innocuum]
MESSFAMQYPAKDLYDDKMDWIEFTTLLAGIMPDTPLGNIISIRAEDDADTLEHFSEEQHRIRDEWRDKQTQRMIESMNKEEVMKEVYAMFMDMSK